MKYKKVTPAKPYVAKKLRNKRIRILVEEEKTKTEIARLIRLARQRAGYSQRELAKRGATTQAVVARLESGNDRRMPSLMLVSRLLKAAHAHLELQCVFEKAA